MDVERQVQDVWSDRRESRVAMNEMGKTMSIAVLRSKIRSSLWGMFNWSQVELMSGYWILKSVHQERSQLKIFIWELTACRWHLKR